MTASDATAYTPPRPRPPPRSPASSPSIPRRLPDLDSTPLLLFFNSRPPRLPSPRKISNEQKQKLNSRYSVSTGYIPKKTPPNPPRALSLSLSVLLPRLLLEKDGASHPLQSAQYPAPSTISCFAANVVEVRIATLPNFPGSPHHAAHMLEAVHGPGKLYMDQVDPLPDIFRSDPILRIHMI